jgi:glycosyltransferase involved in cell wall biosynthesis
MVGTFSFRKGAIDFVDIADAARDFVEFRFVGDILTEARSLMRKAGTAIEFISRVPEHALPEQYAWGDLFIFPTIEDGFAAVLLQAMTSGLLILATPNCSAPDFVREGETGWIVPIRDARAFVERLQWCHTHRAELAEMAERCANSTAQTDWDAMANRIVKLCIATGGTQV